MRFFFPIFIFLIEIGYGQWFQQQSNTARHLYGLDIIDANTGYAVGELSTMRKTTNGGLNWFALVPPVAADFGAISFMDANTGLINGPPFQMLRTTDGGTSFTVYSQPTGGLAEVQMVSSSRAYACGDAIIRSTDGGLSWTQIRSGFLSQYQGVYFINQDSGTVVGRPGLILTTTNGGLNWTQRFMMLPMPLADSTLFAVQFVNSLTGFACGNLGIFVMTTNAGSNWTYYPTGNSIALYGLSFQGTTTGTVVGQGGRIIRTTNGGISWTVQTSPIITSLTDVEFIDANTGWIVGFNGLILKTTNGGVSWIQPISNEIPQRFELYQNYPNPFNPATKIRFAIAKDGNVSLSVYDLLGKQIASLVNEYLQEGIYEINWGVQDLPSGVYIYRLTCPGFSEAKRMVFTK